MSVQKLRDVHKLLSLNGFDMDLVVINQKITRLTAPGENYGSLMLALDVIFKNKIDEKEKILKTVAKMIPPSEFLQTVFNTQVTFKNEIEFYREIIPTLQFVRTNYGLAEMKAFPKSFGARINLNGGKIVDKDAVLLLENLKLTGYTMVDRLKGFDLSATKFIIRELASFHATSLSLKLKQPEIFGAKIKRHLAGFTLHAMEYRKILQFWEMVLNEDEETAKVASKILDILRRGPNKKPREPFATITHNDLWVNNIMVKYQDSELEAVKFIDFQVCDYRSPVADLIFFLFTSVPINILQKHLDYLIEIYYAHFSYTLERLEYDCLNFSLEYILEEISTEVRNAEFFHLAFMVFIVFADKSVVKEVGDIDGEKGIVETINNVQKKWMLFYVKEFLQRGWL